MAESGTKKKITVEIHGQTYTIVGDASTGHMRSVAQEVDDRMGQLAKVFPHLDVAKLAVLSAINICNDYLLLKKEYEALMELLDQKTK